MSDNKVKFVESKTRSQAISANDGGIYFPKDSTSIVFRGKEYGSVPILSKMSGVVQLSNGGTGTAATSLQNLTFLQLNTLSKITSNWGGGKDSALVKDSNGNTILNGDSTVSSFIYESAGNFYRLPFKYVLSYIEYAAVSSKAYNLVYDGSDTGSNIKPVYFHHGLPIEISHTIQSDVPSNAKFTDTTDLTKMTGTLPVAKGGTGQTSLNSAANSLINSLSVGSTTPTDNDYYITQYIGGGTTTTTYHRRTHLSLWNYIKEKISSVLGLTKTNYKGNAASATSATSATYATNSKKLTDTSNKALNSGSKTKPVYFSNGVPQPIQYTIEDNIPSYLTSTLQSLQESIETLTYTQEMILSYLRM